MCVTLNELKSHMIDFSVFLLSITCFSYVSIVINTVYYVIHPFLHIFANVFYLASVASGSGMGPMFSMEIFTPLLESWLSMSSCGSFDASNLTAP